MCSVSGATTTNKNEIVTLAFLTSLFSIGCILLGYIMLPFASAYYAMLLYVEKPQKRVLSYVLPVLFFVINFVVRGFSIKGLLSLDAIVYVILGIIIYHTYKFDKSKGEGVFYATLLTAVAMVFSLIFLAFNSIGAFGMATLEQYYNSIITPIKNDFINLLTSVITQNELGEYISNVNVYQAKAIFRQTMLMSIPVLIITAFSLVGISFKLFTALVKRRDGENRKNCTWRFRATTPVAIFYIIVSVITLFATQEGDMFSLVANMLYMIFFVVFFYIGFNYSVSLIAHKLNRAVATLIVIGAIFILSSFATQLISYVGVYFTFVASKAIGTAKK